MRHTLDTPQAVHDVVLLYLAVIDAEARAPQERQMAIDLARQWAPHQPAEDIEAIVDTAYAAARSGHAIELEALAASLGKQLPGSACKKLLSDLGLIARADGRLTQSEAEAIAIARPLLSDAEGVEAR